MFNTTQVNVTRNWTKISDGDCTVQSVVSLHHYQVSIGTAAPVTDAAITLKLSAPTSFNYATPVWCRLQGKENIATLNIIRQAGSNEDVGGGGETGSGADEVYSGTGWWKDPVKGTVYNKDVPEAETHIFDNDPTEYISVYTKDAAKQHAGRAATSNMTDMEDIFGGAGDFNEDISHWDVSNVTNMRDMFYGASSFNQDISSWDVSNVVSMEYMFTEANSFNQDISSWDVSNVDTMGHMFKDASSFNQDISSWDVSNATDISGMFYNANSFNQDISSWDVSSVTDMDVMFYNASSFNQDLSSWCVSKIPSKPYNFENGSALTPEQLPVWGTCPSAPLT